MKTLKRIFWGLLYGSGIIAIALTFGYQNLHLPILEEISFYFYGACAALIVILLIGMLINIIKTARRGY